MTNTAQNGFTLIELMIVVAIIGILASVALPTYQVYVTRAQVTEAVTIVGELRDQVKEYYKYKGDFPTDNAAAGMPAPNKLLGNFVKNITLENGAFHVQLGNKVNKSLQDKYLTIRPAIVTGSPASPMTWLCGHSPAVEGMEAVGVNKTDIDPAYLPSNCRF
ncbi:pilin [Hahella sp. NBU794]|uniref:pilin n=1 Tax=Hahella sp. NBU794 TaxID=3422590 RepID=UPI003D6E55EE